MIYFSDVDVVTKLAACGFLPLLPRLLGEDEDAIEIEFLPSLLARLRRPGEHLSNPARQGELVEFCDRFEQVRQVENGNRLDELLRQLDPGEAQLFALAEEHGATVVTGDKRALRAYAKVVGTEDEISVVAVFFERLLLRVHELYGYETLLTGCCAAHGSELSGDDGLKIMFSNGEATPEEHALAAINSFIGDISKDCGRFLRDFS